MANSINLVAFGTFGNPNGFKQTFFVGNQNLAKSIKTFDLNTNAIKLFANSRIYSIRKENTNGFNAIAYSLYTYAKEQNSERSGTFIGSSILYTNKIAKEEITISQLNEFHNQLVNKNVSNNTISVNHSDKFIVGLPKDFNKIEFNLREIENLNFSQNIEKNLVVFCNVNENNLKYFFEKSIDLLNAYNTIYFTDSNEVGEFVLQKGIFKIIQNFGEKKDFEIEINNLIEERKRKRDLSISEFEKEIQKINEDRNKTIQDFVTMIQQNEKTHSDNDRIIKESNEDIKRIAQFYDDFTQKTSGLINKLRYNDGKLDEVIQIHNNNKNLFNNSVGELKRPNYIPNIPKPKPKSNLQTSNSQQNLENANGQKKNSEKGRVKFNIYKIATFILTIFLIATWVYIIFIKPELELESIQDQEQTSSEPVEHIPTSEKAKIQEELIPASNSYLNEKDYRILAKKLLYNQKIEDIVNIIFDKNPYTIKDHYKNQEILYAKRLLELNKNCFEEKNGSNYFIKDTIRMIPNYLVK
jgi:hypothetical protein